MRFSLFLCLALLLTLPALADEILCEDRFGGESLDSEIGQESWQRLGALELPEFDGAPRIGLVAEQGNDWISFDDLRLLHAAP